MSEHQDNTRNFGRQESKKPLPIKFGNNYLLIIGIDQYSGGIPRLFNAVNDAEDFKKVLIDHYQFTDEDAYTKVLFNEDATRARIIDVFDELVEKVQPEDSVVFYFSGHGEYLKNIREGYWIPVDAVLNRRATYLSNHEVLNLIKNLKARHVFGVVDSCFSGSLFRNRNLVSVTDRYASTPSRWLFTSGQLEPVSDGSLGDNSPFAKKLISQLTNNPQETLWVSELCMGVMKGFQYDAANQVPEWSPLNGTGHEGGQFVFLRKTAHWESIIEEEIQHKKTQISKTQRSITSNTQPIHEPLSMEPDFSSLDAFKESMELLIGMNEIPRVFNILFERLTNRTHRQTILIRYSSYNDTKQKEEMGIADDRDVARNYAQVKYAFTSVINRLTERDINLD